MKSDLPPVLGTVGSDALSLAQIRDEIEGMETSRVVVDVPRHDQFVRLGLPREGLQPTFHSRRRSDRGTSSHSLHLVTLDRRPQPVHRVDWRWQQTRGSPNQIQELLLGGCEQTTRIRIGVGREHVHSDHRIRLGQLLGGLEVASVQRQGLVQEVGSEVGREGERQTQLGGETSREVARTEQPDRQIQTFTWHCMNAVARPARSEVPPEFLKILGERVQLQEQRAEFAIMAEVEAELGAPSTTPAPDMSHTTSDDTQYFAAR